MIQVKIHSAPNSSWEKEIKNPGQTKNTLKSENGFYLTVEHTD